MNPKTKFVQFESKTENPQFEDVYDIDPKELLKKVEAAEDLHLIDVREPNEYTGELGHVAGAELMPLGSIPQNLDQISKSKTVVFICRSGGRSAQATAFAHSRGIQNAYNMRGGMLLWNQLSLPTE